MLNASPTAMSAARPPLDSGDSANRLSELLLHDSSLDQTLRQTADEIRALSGFPVVNIQLYDAARGRMLHKGRWEQASAPDQIEESSAEVAPFAEVIRNRQPLACFGESAAVLGSDSPLQTLVCAPIEADSALIGVLSLGSPDALPVDEAVFARARSFGRLVALVVERRQSHESLVEAERLLQAALDSLSARIAILDDGGKIVAINTAWRRFAGENESPDPEAYLGINYLQVCDVATGDWAAEAPPVAQGIRDVIAEREVEFHIDYPCHSPTQKRWFTMRVTRFEWAGAVRIVVSHQDVTDLKIGAERVAESENRIRAIVDNVLDGIVTTDEDGVIEAINPAGARIFGCDGAQVIGRNISDLLAGVKRQGDLLETLAAEAHAYQREFTGKRLDGSTFPMYMAVSVVALGERWLYTAIIQDLTESKRVEAERMEKERLRLALEKEKEMTELKSRFVSTLSHELRTPLAAILLANDMLTRFGDRASPEERSEYLTTIKEEVEHLSQMITDILNLSRTEATGLAYHPEPRSVDVLCLEVVAEVQKSIRSKHKIIFDQPSRPVEAFIDEKLLRHAVTNLLTNAVKYSPRGGEVHVTLARKRGRITISVIDQGIGIPEDDLPRLFEPFQRAGNTERISGTGLGLYIVRQAVELHGGKISVDSTLGVGTTFTITLPVKAAIGTTDEVKAV